MSQFQQITRFQEWLLKRITKKLVIQSFDHQQNIIKYYQILTEAARKEFKEDNKITLNEFLSECHREALK